MLHGTYLISLLFVIGCLLLLDWRYKLALWNDKKRTVATLFVGFLLFVSWDLLGIGFGIFLQGDSPYQLPFSIIPQLPIEELFFLFLLCYLTLILYTGGRKLWPRI